MTILRSVSFETSQRFSRTDGLTVNFKHAFVQA